MPKGTMDKAVDFAAKQLRKNPKITGAELKKVGKKAGFTIYPVIVTAARKKVGLSKPRKARKKVGRKAGARKVARRGRPPKAANPGNALDRLASHMRELEREVAALRGALDKIAQISANV